MRKKTRRATGSIVASPVLVGAVTVLIILVAVFLAYNANNGLPFVPTYDVWAQLPGGANLVRGNFIGTDPSGQVAVGVGGSGVHVAASSDPSADAGNFVGGESPEDRNVISGAAAAGAA